MKNIVFTIIATLIVGNIYAQKSESKDLNILSEFEEMKKSFTETEGDWVFSKIIPVDKVSKDDIYNRAIETFSKIYRDSKDVIQSKDKDAGIIIGKGFVDSSIRTINWASICRNRCWHLIKVEARDGRYKITVTVSSVWNETGSDLRHPFNGNEYRLSDFYPYWKDCKPKNRITSFDNLKFVYECSMDVMSSIENGINKNITSSDDW
ncbi:MAG: DUF4468 domain-containing protein [Bacteroides sp.]|uniref:DUF4468 domain-containing protein n=1 Tax=Bacteroides sp. TaxID=29523 RepID=UPI002FC9697D